MLARVPSGYVLGLLFKEKIALPQKTPTDWKSQTHTLEPDNLDDFPSTYLMALTVKEKGYKRDISASDGSLNVHMGIRRFA